MNYTKDAKTIDEQIQLLINRNLIIENMENARNILFTINYYNFTGYLFDCKENDGSYKNITFEQAYSMYLCDKRLKSILLYAIEIIEHNIKTKLAYFIAHEIAPTGYLDAGNFSDDDEHKRLIYNFNKAVKRNKNIPFVKHHIVKYNRMFPIWVAVELFTFGMVWNCYKYIKVPIKKSIAKEFNTGIRQLESWIECISYLRNLSAHYMRLYNFNVQKTPKECNRNFVDFKRTYKIYDIVYVMKFLMPDPDEWNNYIIPTLSQVFEKYESDIDIRAYGFPEGWELQLKI